MSSTNGLQGSLGDPPTDEFGDYQAISTLAVAAVLVGAASATALVAVPLWIVPLVGILLSCLALTRIDRSTGTLVGRPLALTGLGLSICFGVAALADHFASRHLMAVKAEQVASQWFLALAEGDPQLAHQWTMAPGYRAAADEMQSLKSYYESDEKRRDALNRFVSQKLIASLMHLGTRAHVQSESTSINRIDEHLSFISLISRVTADEAGKPVRFLTELTLELRTIPGRPQPRWTVRAWKFVGPEPAVAVN